MSETKFIRTFLFLYDFSWNQFINSLKNWLLKYVTSSKMISQIFKNSKTKTTFVDSLSLIWRKNTMLQDIPIFLKLPTISRNFLKNLWSDEISQLSPNPQSGSAKGSQQELHPKFFKPFGYCCSLLWSSNSSSMSSPSITCHTSWSNNHIVWLWTLCTKINIFVAVSLISRFQWPFDTNFVQMFFIISGISLGFSPKNISQISR